MFCTKVRDFEYYITSIRPGYADQTEIVEKADEIVGQQRMKAIITESKKY